MDPLAKSLTFCRFKQTRHEGYPKRSSLKIQPNSSKGFSNESRSPGSFPTRREAASSPEVGHPESPMRTFESTSRLSRSRCGHGSKPMVPPVNIPIPTKIDYNGWCTVNPQMVPLVLKHRHVFPAIFERSYKGSIKWGQPRGHMRRVPPSMRRDASSGEPDNIWATRVS